TANLQWHAANCCYSGWSTLLSGLETIPATNMAAWRVLWRNDDGEKAATEGWPAAGSYESAECLPDAFRPAPFPDSPVGYGATIGGPIGGDPTGLSRCHENWESLTYDRVAFPPVDLLSSAPTIPSSPERLYCGETLDLTRIDLGEHLHSVQQSQKLAPKVVV